MDAIESAKRAGLRYIPDEAPGIRRVRRGRGFSYIGLDSKPIRDARQLDRFRKLAIPPAWTDVWICPFENGHIQATGRDAKDRKQYIYHPLWAEHRNLSKYSRLIAFGEALPGIRRQVSQDLALRGLPREKVVAAVVRLMETTLIRVGNPEYARANRSFGLTTLRDRHVEVMGARLRFEFRGKSGQQHKIEVKDRRLARIVKRCRDVPGYELFQYLDDEGQRQQVSSTEVNRFLLEVTGQDFTAKDFRTWGGTVLALRQLKDLGPEGSERKAKRNVAQAVSAVANHLGNKPATCRKYYIHPAVIDTYMEGGDLGWDNGRRERDETPIDGLEADEAALLRFLRQIVDEEADTKTRR